MKQLDHARTLLRGMRVSPLSLLSLSRNKRLLIVVLSYILGEVGLWFLFPLVHNGASMFVPIITACWLFRYRGLLVSLVLNGIAFQLTYIFLLRGELPDQAFVEGGVLGFGTSLVLGLVVCWLRTTVDRVHIARSLPPQQERMQALPEEGHVAPTSTRDQEKINEPKDTSLQPMSSESHTPPIVLGDSLEGLKELHGHLTEMKQTDVPTDMVISDRQETRLGQQVGEYRLVHKLGGGGFGTVYLAEHVHERMQAAVKVLHIPLTKQRDFKDFLNEARTMRLRHPYIVPLLDFGISRDDLPFLVMEYAPEGTLRDRHPESERVALSTIVFYVDQLASALQYAHDHRIIHRDVKPENILIRIDGTLMMSDFGLAKLQEQNTVISQQRQVGSPAYMAPEQHRGYPCFASDQYALGVIVYEWISGVRPFQGTVLGVVDQHMNTPPLSLRYYLPELPEAVERIIFKALAKAPEDRFERIEEFADALRQTVSPRVDRKGYLLDGF